MQTKILVGLKVWLGVLALSVVAWTAGAQEWAGSITTVDSVYRMGNVGIGATDPQQSLHAVGVTPIRLDRSGVGHVELGVDNIGGVASFVVAPRTQGSGVVLRFLTSDSTLTTGVVLDSTGKVGIGQTNPDGTLHVFSGSAGSIAADGNRDDLIVENSDHAGISILAPNSSTSSIVFGDNNDADVGGIIYNHNAGANTMAFSTNAVTRMIISGSGNVGIGTSSPSSILTIEEAEGSKFLALNRNSDSSEKAYLKIDGSSSLVMGVNAADRMVIDASGNVGIGQNAPEVSKLYMQTGASITDPITDSASLGRGSMVIAGDGVLEGKVGLIFSHSVQAKAEIASAIVSHRRGSAWGTELAFHVHPNDANDLDELVEAMRIDYSGNVGIGTTTPGTHKLAVAGTIKAEEIVLESSGADFVFEANYPLRPLPEVESHIQAHKHLPEIPSAAEMQAEGVSMSQMQTKLLQKVEELTLYAIEQDKQISRQNAHAAQQEAQIQEQNALVAALLKRVEQLEVREGRPASSR